MWAVDMWATLRKTGSGLTHISTAPTTWDRFLSEFGAALAEGEGEEGIWRRAVRMLAEGMKIERVCRRQGEGDCICWDAKMWARWPGAWMQRS